MEDREMKLNTNLKSSVKLQPYDDPFAPKKNKVMKNMPGQMRSGSPHNKHMVANMGNKQNSTVNMTNKKMNIV